MWDRPGKRPQTLSVLSTSGHSQSSKASSTFGNRHCIFGYFREFCKNSAHFRERTVWFISWKNSWHGLTSSENELCSTFPEEVRAVSGRETSSGKELLGSFPEEVTARPDTAWLLQGMNYTVHSLKKSGRARPCQSNVINFSGNEPHVLSLKKVRPDHDSDRNNFLRFRNSLSPHSEVSMTILN